MKLQILYLSDLHIKDETTLPESRIADIIDCLKVEKAIENCLIVISGDIAFSGQKVQYDIAEKRLLFLKQKLEEIYGLKNQIQFLFVPGNHDNDYKGIHMNCEDVAKIANKEAAIWNENEKLQAFFAFAKKFNCFNRNPYFHLSIIDFGGYKIQALLFNSAIYSVFCDQYGANEKGMHYVSRRSMDIIEKLTQETNLSIFVSHHSPEWFDEASKHLLEEYICRNTSLAFWGHEHYNFTYNYGACVFKGGVLSGENGKSDFYSLIIDTRTNAMKSYHAEFDSRAKMYCLKEGEESFLDEKKCFRPLEKFIAESINQPIPNLHCKMEDVFVFPRIYSKTNSFEVENEVLTMKDLLGELKESTFCVVTGDDLSGKTTLMKELYLAYVNDGEVPLYLTAEALTKVEPRKLIKYNFFNQYGDDEVSYQKYMRLPKEKKVLLIDDIHTVKTKKIFDQFLKNEEENFARIIVSTSKEQLDILDALKVESENKEMLKLSIAPFYVDKRKELIEKVVKVSDAYLSGEIQKYIDAIDKSIQNQLRFFSLTPQFIVFYTISFIQRMISADGNSNVFNTVFHTNITNLLKTISGINIRRTMQILQDIAYYVHVNKAYPLPTSEFIRIIEEFNRDHPGGMRAQGLANSLEKIGIIKILEDDTVIFTSKNYLAFFVAYALNGKLGTEEGIDQLRLLLQNLCFGINSDILLFLSYLTNRTEIIDFILSESEGFLSDWIENDLDKKNLKCLFVDFNAPKINYPTSEQKAQRTQDMIKHEEKVVRTEMIQTTDIYDYDPSEIDQYVNKQTKVIKLIEIVSKILPNFEHMLTKAKMERIVDNLYSMPNKLVYYMFKPFDDNFEETVEEIVEVVNNYREEDKKITKAQGIIILQDLMTAMMLTLYDYSMRLATTEETYPLLMDSSRGKTICNKIQQCLVLYQSSDFEKLGRMLESIYDNTNTSSIKFMVLKIAKNYLLYHDVPYVHYGQHFIDKFFPDKKILTERKKLKAKK